LSEDLPLLLRTSIDLHLLPIPDAAQAMQTVAVRAKPVPQESILPAFCISMYYQREMVSLVSIGCFILSGFDDGIAGNFIRRPENGGQVKNFLPGPPGKNRERVHREKKPTS